MELLEQEVGLWVSVLVAEAKCQSLNDTLEPAI